MTPWTSTCQAPLSMGFSGQEHWSGYGVGTAISFSRGSSRPRDQIWVSCIAGRFFTNWAMREAHIFCILTHIFQIFQNKDKGIEKNTKQLKSACSYYWDTGESPGTCMIRLWDTIISHETEYLSIYVCMCIHIYIYEQQFHPQTQQKHMHMFTKRSIQKCL